MERLDALEEFTRQRSASRGPRIPVESNATVDRFLAVVRQRGEELHALVHPEEGVNRFLGNASFHASAVFDDPRLKDLAFVSQRNATNARWGSTPSWRSTSPPPRKACSDFAETSNRASTRRS